MSRPGAALIIPHRGGYVQITDMTGDIDVQAKPGDIMLMVPQPGAYAIDAECEFRGIYSDYAGNSKREHLIGPQIRARGAGAGAPDSSSHGSRRNNDRRSSGEAVDALGSGVGT